MTEQPGHVSGTDFGAAADDYRRGRPDYPADLVVWLVGDATRITDAGAGTGKLTASLVGTGRQVTAVDPDPRMLSTLGEDLPEVTTHTGSAEHLPLPDHSAEVITYGQAWHWVDPAAASTEAARVLVPGGVLGLIWNVRDESEPWVAELTSIITASAAEQLIASGGPTVHAPFGEPERRQLSWERTLTVEDLRSMIASRSYLIAAPERERTDIMERATALATKVAGPDGTLRLPYRTEAYRAVNGS